MCLVDTAGGIELLSRVLLELLGDLVARFFLGIQFDEKIFLPWSNSAG